MKYNVEMLDGRKERKSILNCFHKERNEIKKMHGTELHQK